MAYTYDNFVSAANAAGLMNQFSEQDLQIAQRNPEFGLSLLSLLKDNSNATTAEQQLLATDIGGLLASGADRLLAVVLQMALAQLMMTAVAKRKGWYTVLTVVLQHVCVCTVVWVGEVTQSMPLCLAVRVIFTAAAILLALRTKELWTEKAPEAGVPRSETWNARLPRRSQ